MYSYVTNYQRVCHWVPLLTLRSLSGDEAHPTRHQQRKASDLRSLPSRADRWLLPAIGHPGPFVMPNLGCTKTKQFLLRYYNMVIMVIMLTMVIMHHGDIIIFLHQMVKICSNGTPSSYPAPVYPLKSPPQRWFNCEIIMFLLRITICVHTFIG